MEGISNLRLHFKRVLAHILRQLQSVLSPEQCESSMGEAHSLYLPREFDPPMGGNTSPPFKAPKEKLQTSPSLFTGLVEG